MQSSCQTSVSHKKYVILMQKSNPESSKEGGLCNMDDLVNGILYMGDVKVRGCENS